MQIKVEGINEVKSLLNRLRTEEIPKAMEITINKTLGQMKTKLQNEIRKVFDRPKAWSVTTLFIDPASASKKKYSASIQVRKQRPQGTPAVNVLSHNITGGKRALKGHENWMIGMGFMKPGQFIVPGPHARRDKFGNQTNAEIKSIIQALKSTGEIKGWKVFISNDGKTVFSVKNQRVKILWYIVDNVNYSKRYEFFNVGTAEANKLLIDNANFSIQKAIERR